MMGLTPVELGEMELKYFFLKLHFFNEREQEQFQSHANLIRLQTLSLINIQLSPKDKIRSLTALWVFPWDEEKKQTPANVKPANVFQNVKKLSQLL